MELAEIYRLLLAKYGEQHWWPGEGGFETVAGAILTQHAGWPNAELALRNLRNAGALNIPAIMAIDEPALVDLIRPAGCFTAKARALRAVCALFTTEFGGSLRAGLSAPLAEIRSRLLHTCGIGPETADAILLYAGEHPTFVVDAYARRIFNRLGASVPRDTYEEWRFFFMSRLPAEVDVYREYHALLVRHGKETCLKTPRCHTCPLADVCVSSAKMRGRIGLQSKPAP